jgi:16S rRNA (guanine966-N2)-methyltransferase
MKDRVREAIFNLLGPVTGMHALDLFAGTGALGFEAISRGAARATFVERHFPTAGLIRRNAGELGVAERCEIVAADTFIWVQKQLMPQQDAWLAFISPPFAFYHDRRDDMLALVETLLSRAPPGSVAVVESDEEFDLGLLPQAENWRVRHYSPAAVAILRTSTSLAEPSRQNDEKRTKPR